MQLRVAEVYLMRFLASQESIAAVLAESETEGVVSVVAWWRIIDGCFLVSSETSDGAAKVERVVSSNTAACFSSVPCAKGKSGRAVVGRTSRYHNGAPRPTQCALGSTESILNGL